MNKITQEELGKLTKLKWKPESVTFNAGYSFGSGKVSLIVEYGTFWGEYYILKYDGVVMAEGQYLKVIDAAIWEQIETTAYNNFKKLLNERPKSNK